MVPNLNIPSPLQLVTADFLQEKNITLYLKREDVIHPEITGNKWRKIKYNLQQFNQTGLDTILTFGGAYSNHIRATAATGKAVGFKTIGIIRGDEFTQLNPTLQFAKDCGMQLQFISREQYRQKTEPNFIQHLEKQYGTFYLLPEGGSNRLALQGCAEIIAEIDVPFDIVCCACGTGTTLAGLVAGLAGRGHALGFAVLKGDFLQEEVSRLLQEAGHEPYTNFLINTDYHFGGYGKTTPGLFQFIHQLNEGHDLQVDYVYNGKMLYGLWQMIQAGSFSPGTTILALITGGLSNASTFTD